MERKKIFIDRSKWRTGGNPNNVPPQYKDASEYFYTGEGDTSLLNDQGHMCCLGFVCSQVDPGINILSEGEPGELLVTVIGLNISYMSHYDNEYDHYSDENEYFTNTELSCDAMTINDNPTLSPSEKEAALEKLFTNSPYELVFEGDYTTKE